MSLTHAKVLAEADDPTQAARARPSDWNAAHVGVLDIANGGTGSITAALARTALGLGSVATQPSPLDLLHGGTGGTDAPSARTALGLGNIALEASPLATTKGGTGLTAMGTANQVLGMNAGATALEYKTLAGTLNRLTVTHTAGSVAFDLSAAYVGQTSIITLGTIATGTWNATAIGPTYGGTGLDTHLSSGILSLNAGTWTINNVLTANRVLYAAAGNTIGSNANFVFDGTNVGIGTTVPGAPLQVTGASAAGGVAIFQSFDTATSDLAIFRRSDAAVSARINYNGTDGNISWGTSTNHSISFITNNAEKVRIGVSGNVGVGIVTQINELVTLKNASWLGAVNFAGTGSQKIIGLNASNLIAFGSARAAATLAANFSADFYIRFQDVLGAEFYVPAKNAAW